MATAQHTARRALLKGALAAPLAASLGGVALASSEAPILQLYQELEALDAHIIRIDLTEGEFDRLYAVQTDLEQRMVKEPVTCAADLAAKVLVLTSLREADGCIYEPSVQADCKALLAQKVAA